MPGPVGSDRTREPALELASMNPVVLPTAEVGCEVSRDMPWEHAEDHLCAKLEQSRFLVEKSYRPGLAGREATERPEFWGDLPRTGSGKAQQTSVRERLA
ncbi:hypothetical protein E1202_11055 [Saccharopolyspora karakumensis]|uniref:AMP-binding enzyme C-terminal domain-containing protein n=1 Tax=Saccharopolyspora karakumensis TaxID=2530386 RepID=A0A4R5BQZ8_9PSEU|nr:hypothetical protein [Saccharopolyspora karakumensis]TDD89388.1 hypothetical protein E1202_11055 [Saccharopolyspora karakumensis]